MHVFDKATALDLQGLLNNALEANPGRPLQKDRDNTSQLSIAAFLTCLNREMLQGSCQHAETWAIAKELRVSMTKLQARLVFGHVETPSPCAAETLEGQLESEN